VNQLITKIWRFDPSWLFLVAAAAFEVIYFTTGIIRYLALWRFL